MYRLSRPEHANDLSGFGSSLVGGRWNYPGEFVLYTAQTASLSILEVLVHLNGVAMGVRYELLKLELKIEIIEEIDQIPSSEPDNIAACREIGSEWLSKRESPVLTVPSVLNPLEKNYLINPQHPQAEVKIAKKAGYFFDGRLVKQ